LKLFLLCKLSSLLVVIEIIMLLLSSLEADSSNGGKDEDGEHEPELPSQCIIVDGTADHITL